MSEFTAIESKTDYQIISAVITNSDRNQDLSVDIKRLISSFQIFEHIEKPYLTAQFVVVDTADLIQDYDFQGAEKITIEIIQAEEQNEGTQITKVSRSMYSLNNFDIILPGEPVYALLTFCKDDLNT